MKDLELIFLSNISQDSWAYILIYQFYDSILKWWNENRKINVNHQILIGLLKLNNNVQVLQNRVEISYPAQ
jgi:hypothetical protein